MGIQMISAPKGQMNEATGPLPLPASFNRKKLAAKWVKVGNAVHAAKERESIIGTNLTADGWEVWKFPDDVEDLAGKPHKVPLQNGEYILLCRPRAVQDAVNAIAGNVGKERLLAEKRGETTGGVPVDDPGLLSDDRITRVTGEREDLGSGDVIMNHIPDVERGERITKPTVRIKTKVKSE